MVTLQELWSIFIILVPDKKAPKKTLWYYVSLKSLSLELIQHHAFMVLPVFTMILQQIPQINYGSAFFYLKAQYLKAPYISDTISQLCSAVILKKLLVFKLLLTGTECKYVQINL